MITVTLLILGCLVLNAQTSAVQNVTCGTKQSHLLLMTSYKPKSGVYVACGSRICKWDGHEILEITVTNDTDAEAKVLAVSESHLLYCYTNSIDHCAVYDPATLRLLGPVSNENNFTQLVTHGSVLAFFASVTYFEGSQRYGLYLASGSSEYKLNQPTLSTRELEQNGTTFQLDILREIMTTHYDPPREFSVQRDLTLYEHLSIRYIYGFSESNFVYYITVQKEYSPGDTSHVFKTYLIRTCQRDDGYSSIAQIELICESKVGHYSSRYDIAETGFLQGKGKSAILFVAFGRSEDLSSFADQQFGSVICSYNLADIQQKYFDAFTDCYAGEGFMLPSFHQNNKYPCRNYTKEARHIRNGGVDYCWDPEAYNKGIGFGYDVPGRDVITIKDQFITMLAAEKQRGMQVLFTGTSDGNIQKIGITQDSASQVYHTLNLSGGKTNVTVARDVRLDGTFLYVMASNKVFRVDVSSCGIYSDCSSCVQSQDPLKCGWCSLTDSSLSGTCTDRRLCSGANSMWNTDMCFPYVDELLPRSGPVNGGTHVTMSGSHFGNWTYASTVIVHMGNSECRLINKTNDRIICSTDSNSGSFPVSISVGNSTVAEVYSRDTSKNFHFKEVMLTSAWPLIGHHPNGSHFFLSGSNLDCGVSAYVTMAQKICSIKKRSENLIECTTTTAYNESFLGQSGLITLDIDHFHAKMQSKLFTPEPQLNDVFPNKSLASGGITITFYGEDLDSHENYFITINNDTSSKQECLPIKNGGLMTCLTPAAPDSSSLHDNASLCVDQIVTVFVGREESFTMKTFGIDYCVDPVIFRFPYKDNILTLGFDSKQLRISGSNLDLGVSISEYQVTIGDELCDVIILSTLELACEFNSNTSLVGVAKPVMVRIGAEISFEVGYLVLDSSKPAVSSVLSSPESLTKWVAPTVTIGLFAVVLCIVGLACYINKGKRKEKRRRMEPAVMFSAHMPEREDVEDNEYMAPRQGHSEVSPLIPAAACALAAEHLKLLEASNILINRHRLQILRAIGKGNFGEVHRGLLEVDGQKGEMDVAVKTLKSSGAHSLVEEVDSFLNEALRMKEFQHRNVLTLIGIVLDEKSGLPLVILPFMKHGDLLSFLRDERNYPPQRMLLQFALDIANGMDYLVNLKFVHRDLAARNCMLDEDLNVLVGDFGMSRDVYGTQYYSSSDKMAKVPIKWMAPECLDKNVYNSSSDVWSFGVTIWELISRGSLPYPGVENWDIVRYLHSGRRLDKPDDCPMHVYQLMLRCWELDPVQRPTFAELAKNLDIMIQEAQYAPEHAPHTEATGSPYVNVSHAHEDVGGIGVMTSPRAYPKITENDGFSHYVPPISSDHKKILVEHKEADPYLRPQSSMFAQR